VSLKVPWNRSTRGADAALEAIKANETDATSAPTTNNLRMLVTPFSPQEGDRFTGCNPKSTTPRR
jgi:hypothetical protein